MNVSFGREEEEENGKRKEKEKEKKKLLYIYGIVVLPGSILSAFFDAMRGLNREKLHCTATICKCPKTTFDLQRRSEKLPVGDQGQLGHCIMGERKTCPPQPLQKHRGEKKEEKRRVESWWVL